MEVPLLNQSAIQDKDEDVQHKGDRTLRQKINVTRLITDRFGR